MIETMRISVIGSVCYDEYFITDHWIDEGDKAIVRVVESVAGGMVANAACVLAGLGNAVYFFDSMNDGERNQKLLKDLNAFKVNTDYISLSDLPDARSLILSTPKERTIFVVDRGAAPIYLSRRQIDILRDSTLLYSTMSDFRRCNESNELINVLRSDGVRIAFDVEPSTFGSAEEILFSQADILLFNRQGFEKYAQGDPNWQPFLTKLLQLGVSAIVITMGSQGCYGVTQDEEVRLDAIPVSVVDTTGAGDTFNASFIHCFLRKKGLKFSMQFANAAASRAVTRHGARSGVSDYCTIEQHMISLYGGNTEG